LQIEDPRVFKKLVYKYKGKIKKRVKQSSILVSKILILNCRQYVGQLGDSLKAQTADNSLMLHLCKAEGTENTTIDWNSNTELQ
jgi:hypothetical protein